MTPLSLVNTYFFPILEWVIYAATLHRILGQGKRKPAAGILLFCLIAGATVISADLVEISVILLQAFLVISTTVISLVIYKAPLHIAAFFSIAVYYISILADLLIGNFIVATMGIDILSLIATDMVSTLIFNIAAKLIQITLSYFLVRGFRKISWTIPAIYWIVMDIIVASYGLISISFMFVNPYLQTQVEPVTVSIMVVVFLLANVLTVILFSTISTHYINTQLEYAASATRARLDNDLIQFEKDRSDLRKTNHDFKNTLNNIALLVRDESNGEALEYINDFTSTLPDAPSERYTDLAGVDSIISLKAAAAEAHHIKMEVEADSLPAQGISIVDIVTVLSNMLDNAIEGNYGVPPGASYIKLRCFVAGNFLNLVVSNPYRRAPLRINNRLITSKKDLDAHGYGTIIVREICESHSGSFLIEYANGVFEAHATMYIEQPEQQPQ